MYQALKFANMYYKYSIKMRHTTVNCITLKYNSTPNVNDLCFYMTRILNFIKCESMSLITRTSANLNQVQTAKIMKSEGNGLAGL